MDLSQIKKIHCLGIGGIGVSAVAKFFLAQGKEVRGSDVSRSEITKDLERRGVKIFYGHRAGQIAPDTDLIVYSPAVSLSNPEILKDIKILSYPEFLGELSKEYYTIAVSGTHGKSTTTALIGLMLEAAGLDPLVIVGSQVPEWELGNIRLNHGTDAELDGTNTELGGRRRFLVIEACEHQANMLNLHPQAVVVTNVEPDHLDYYGNFNNIKNAFQKFIQLVPKGGLVVYNGDREAGLDWNYARPSVLKLIWQLFFKVRPAWRSFGFQEGNDYRATDRQVKDGRQYFNISPSGRSPAGGQFPNFSAPRHIRLNIPGKFNVYNALAAIAVTLELGVSIEACQKVLAEFKGLWRRFEIVGDMKINPLYPIPYTPYPIIISDYGHHPTAIHETLRAARELFPGRRLVLIYQPHQHNRTKMLFDGFVRVLQEPDILILSEIYEVTGREAAEDQLVSSVKLLEAMKEKTKDCYYGGDLEETERLTRQIIKEGDVVIVMGAGDVDQVARRLVMTDTIQENVPLAPLTTFNIGGPAKFFAMVSNLEDLKASFSWAKTKNLPILILSGGSNLLIPDKGWEGLVIKIAIGGWTFNLLPKYLTLNTKYLIQVGSGVHMIALAQEAARLGLTGLEWAGGLPGTVGGAVRGNAGSFRFEIGQSVKTVKVLRHNQTLTLNQKDCGFGYRTSWFKNKFKDDIILEVALELTAGQPEESQKQLQDFLAHRQKSQPSLPSAGCIFKNIIIADTNELSANLRELLPSEFIKYQKIPAGWLVEKAGMKGARVGQAQVSPRHANFIINLGKATSLDVLNLIKQIKEKVYNKFGVELEEEVQIIEQTKK